MAKAAASASDRNVCIAPVPPPPPLQCSLTSHASHCSVSSATQRQPKRAHVNGEMASGLPNQYCAAYVRTRCA
jgi:hypothetical protein